MKYVIIDEKEYMFEDPYDCCFNYDGVACGYPQSDNHKPAHPHPCIGWHPFPKDCPLREKNE